VSSPSDETPTTDGLFKFGHGHRVRYDEIDAQGIVGTSSWFSILQLGRTEYLRYLGLVIEGGNRTPLQILVRRSQIDFLSPARFDDPLMIRVRCAYLGNKSAKLEYLVDNLDTGLRPIIAETLVVCTEGATLRSITWPNVFRQRVQELEGPNVQVGQS
jgi:acyl-CoA thioester hydrolase